MAQLRSVWLQENTWEDVAEYLRTENLIILPIGSTENHGPAGPLGVDSYIAMAMAEDAAKETGVLVAPPLWYGESPQHMEFPGTITLRSETLIAVTMDVVRSLVHHGFKKFIVINGHRGTNLAALTIACRNLHEELPETFMCLVDPMHIGRTGAEFKHAPEHHAGEVEISQFWYRFPDLIRADKLTRQGVDLKEILSRFANNDLYGRGGGDSIEMFYNGQEERGFAPSGSLSDSSQASPENGKKFHEHLVKNLVEFIGWLKKFEGPIGKK